MSLNSTLKAALEPVAPVEADTYEGKAAVYITINYNSFGADYGDDEPDHERFLIQAHLYAPTGYDTVSMRKDVKRRLSAAGTTWPSCTNASDKNGQHHVFECEIVQAAGME